MRFRPDWLHDQAGQRPAAPALTVAGRTYTFAQLARRIDQLAARFIHQGWTGGPIGVWLPDGLAMIAAVWASPRAGGVLVPFHARLPAPELADQLARLGIQRLYTDHELYAAVKPHLPETVQLLFAGEDIDQAGEGGEGVVVSATPVPDHTLHTILLTSGTTGHPKAVQLTYENHHASALAWRRFLKLVPGDHYLGTLPLSHVGGLGILFRSALAGCQVTCLPRFDAETANALLDRGGVTHVSLVPTQLQRLLLRRDERPFPASLKALVLGGAPAAPGLIDAALQLGAPLVKTYGLTETASGVAAFHVPDHPHKKAAAGQPLGQAVLTIEDDDAQPLPPNRVGRIVVAGPTVMVAYIGGPPTGGRLVTGDRGWLDNDGFLTIAADPAGLIISGGENVDPCEVEQVLLTLPGVLEACVVGLPDADLGQRVVAVVSGAQGRAVDVETLQQACRQRLAPFKTPKEIIVWPALPKTPTGKVQRGQVLENLLRDQDAGEG